MGLPEIRSTVRTLEQTSDGTLWIGTIGNGLWTYKNGVLSLLNSLLPSNTVLKILEDDSHQVWIGLQDALVRLGRTPVGVVPLPGGSDADFETISGNNDRSLWVVASGVYKISDGVARPYRFAELPDVRVRNIFRDREGELWVGRDGSGAYRITAHGILHYSAPHELTNNFIRAFLESRQGDFWMATDEGVSCIGSQDVQKFTMKDGLVYFSTRSLLEDHADLRVWRLPSSRMKSEAANRWQHRLNRVTSSLHRAHIRPRRRGQMEGWRQSKIGLKTYHTSKRNCFRQLLRIRLGTV
jgi:ligand-binding sensor domain-containing protein